MVPFVRIICIESFSTSIQAFSNEDGLRTQGLCVQYCCKSKNDNARNTQAHKVYTCSDPRYVDLICLEDRCLPLLV